MSEMIERVARKLAVFYGGPLPVEAARAVIGEMREPTQAMTFAGSDAGGEPDFACATIWQAMIDAALRAPLSRETGASE